MQDLFSEVPNQHVTFPALDITLPSHNKNGNDAQYQENKSHFSNQAQKVLEHLKRGEWVSGMQMNQLYGIQDIRPRIASIKRSGNVLEERKIKGAHGAKEWRISPSE
jgi:hypothetical protein